ncbi:MAG: hypothetical protein LV481_02600 [Methylacidiphilales bacterium]|nr:hypothetical protein [Candidatus Methylacidiphilales bacterium]
MSRALLLTFFAALLVPTLADSDNANTLPSRKANIVVPLLNQISSKDSPTNVLKRLNEIIGCPDGGDGAGSLAHPWEVWFYFLNDKTQIYIDFDNNKFGGVQICIPGQKWKVLYTAPNTPGNSVSTSLAALLLLTPVSR